MKLQGSLACLLLALCLGGGAANPLHSGGGDSGESAAHGMGDALGQGHGEEGVSPLMGSRGDVFDEPRLGEAVRSLGDAGNEIGRQAEDIIRRGVDAVHNSGSWGTSGGNGVYGSQGGIGGQGNPGLQGTPWATGGNYGTNSLGGSVGQGGNGGPLSYETNAQGAVAQPGYGTVRGNNQNSGCTNPPPSGSHESSYSSSGESSSDGSRGAQGGRGSNSQGNSGGGSGGQGNGGGNSGGNGGNGGGNSGNGGNSGSSGGGGNSGSGSRDLETSNFDEGYSVSRGSSSSSSSRGGSGGGNRPECNNPGNDVRMPGGSQSQESKESGHLLGGSHDYQGHGSNGGNVQEEAVSGLKSMNSDKSSLPFNFDDFWENFKSKMGFINWDAINKDNKGSSRKP